MIARMRIKLLLAATALSLTGTPLQAQEPASAWPSKPVTLIIANVPGGTTDGETRLYVQKLTDTFGKPFVIDYKPGAGGTVGGAHVAKATPDGYTLLVATASYTVTPAFATDMSYDTLKDLAPVSLMTKRPTVLIARLGFPANTMAEYIAYAKANPGKINWAAPGAGGIGHLGGIWLHSDIGAPATFVLYKGSAQMFPDLLAGRVDVYPASLQTATPPLKAGKVKIIGILELERVAQLPGVRTAHEEGIKGHEQPSYLGIVATGRTPTAVINRISGEFAKLAKAPDIAKKLEPDGTVMVGSTPEVFNQFVVREITRWTRLVKENNIKQE